MEKMTVTNLFNMSFGKTFFVGVIEGSSTFIKKGKWKLLVNNNLVDEIEIEGEQIPIRKNAQTEERVLASTKIFDKSLVRIGIDKIVLEKIQNLD
ncbi:hypothetical protein [Fibrella aquatilis]|uniref:Uncharacterized protein n=1 Tax=Fibrella aquatilis TaxID=2817059 RepID=A0A939G6U1_9BACT|nr:hypothetical protein [Fibrella aquatilis]MBO0932105.1 hypothetical protein [Fibrella aquatilis]